MASQASVGSLHQVQKMSASIIHLRGEVAPESVHSRLSVNQILAKNSVVFDCPCFI